jgi:hypothetical protein
VQAKRRAAPTRSRRRGPTRRHRPADDILDALADDISDLAMMVSRGMRRETAERRSAI